MQELKLKNTDTIMLLPAYEAGIENCEFAAGTVKVILV